jgi:hypothetical protein
VSLVSFAMKQQEFCQRLGAALKTNTHCREINLSGCSIDSTGAKLLAEGFANNKTLRVVDLSANKIGNDGSQAIAEALMTNCAINEINLLGQPGAFGESCLGKKRKKNFGYPSVFQKTWSCRGVAHDAVRLQHFPSKNHLEIGLAQVVPNQQVDCEKQHHRKTVWFLCVFSVF